jgi:hypothetical protein
MSVTITAQEITRANNPQPLGQTESGIVRANVYNDVVTDLNTLATAIDTLSPSGGDLVATDITLDDGTVSDLAIKIGADLNNGIYGVSDTQLGIAVEGTLVAGANTSGLFTSNIAEQIVTVGVTVDGLLIKDGGFLTTKSNVTQGTSKTTTVVTSANAGTITTVALSDAAAGTFNFTVTNPLALADSNIQLTVNMNGSTGIAYVTHTKGAGSFVITVTNIATVAAFNAAIKIDYLIS